MVRGGGHHLNTGLASSKVACSGRTGNSTASCRGPVCSKRTTVFGTAVGNKLDSCIIHAKQVAANRALYFKQAAANRACGIVANCQTAGVTVIIQYNFGAPGRNECVVICGLQGSGAVGTARRPVSAVPYHGGSSVLAHGDTDQVTAAVGAEREVVCSAGSS